MGETGNRECAYIAISTKPVDVEQFVYYAVLGFAVADGRIPSRVPHEYSFMLDPEEYPMADNPINRMLCEITQNMRPQDRLTTLPAVLERVMALLRVIKYNDKDEYFSPLNDCGLSEIPRELLAAAAKARLDENREFDPKQIKRLALSGEGSG